MRLNNLEGNIPKNVINTTTASSSQYHYRLLTKFFPIDYDEKLLKTLEEKLNEDKIFSLVVTCITNLLYKIKFNQSLVVINALLRLNFFFLKKMLRFFSHISIFQIYENQSF